jgi:hypothetical protein
METTP